MEAKGRIRWKKIILPIVLEVISHNAKYGMENKKDPSNPASYANKGKDTDKILSLVNEEFLSGEGYRKAKSE
jgi:hypothetical protein